MTFFSHILVARGKLQKFVQHIFHAHTYTYFAYPIDFFFFCMTNFEKKKTNLSSMVSLWYDSWCWFLFVPFWNNQFITKWWAKFKLECLVLICTYYTNTKFIVISKPRTLNDGGEDSVNPNLPAPHEFCSFWNDDIFTFWHQSHEHNLHKICIFVFLFVSSSLQWYMPCLDT